MAVATADSDKVRAQRIRSSVRWPNGLAFAVGLLLRYSAVGKSKSGYLWYPSPIHRDIVLRPDASVLAVGSF